MHLKESYSSMQLQKIHILFNMSNFSKFSFFVVYPINKLIKGATRITEEDRKRGKRAKKNVMSFIIIELFGYKE